MMPVTKEALKSGLSTIRSGREANHSQHKRTSHACSSQLCVSWETAADSHNYMLWIVKYNMCLGL